MHEVAKVLHFEPGVDLRLDWWLRYEFRARSWMGERNSSFNGERMSELMSALFAAALSLPPPWFPPNENPETEAQYTERLRVISAAVAKEAEAAPGWSWGSRSLAFAALTIMYQESRFALSVHDGSKLGDFGRASCLGQIHANGLVPKREWEQLTGTDMMSTRRCARATMRMLATEHRVCSMQRKSLSPENLARVFAAYASGGRCRITKDARSRASLWSRLSSASHTTDEKS